MKNKLVLYYTPPETQKGKDYGSPVRIRPETYRKLREVCVKCRMTTIDTIDVMLGFAMDNLELKPVPLYDLGFKEETDDTAN